MQKPIKRNMNIALMEYVIFFTDFAVQFSHTFLKNGATLWIPSRACLVFSISPDPPHAL